MLAMLANWAGTLVATRPGIAWMPALPLGPVIALTLGRGPLPSFSLPALPMPMLVIRCSFSEYVLPAEKANLLMSN